MKKKILVLALISAMVCLWATGCSTAQKPLENSKSEASQEDRENRKVILGDEQFDEYVPLLKDKRVALFSNHTGIVGDETSKTGEEDENTHFGLDSNGNIIVYGEHILDALIL